MKLISVFLMALMLGGVAWGQPSGGVPGFTDQTTGTPISVTTGGNTGTLPGGSVVVASNVGSNTAYCKPGATATLNDQAITPGSWFAFQVGLTGATQLTCITSASTTTVNLVGGTGFPVGSGGGSGGGAITGTVTATPFAATPTVSPANTATSLVLKASPSTVGVQSFHAETTGSAAGFCVLYNGTAAPGTGALTAANVLAFQSFPSNGWCDWTATSNAITASIGAVVLVTSAATPFTYTTGVVTAAIYGVAP